jgi:hypothetical protein
MVMMKDDAASSEHLHHKLINNTLSFMSLVFMIIVLLLALSAMAEK